MDAESFESAVPWPWAMEAATDHITAEEYFAVSREGDRTQLIDGVMVVNEALFRRS